MMRRLADACWLRLLWMRLRATQQKETSHSTAKKTYPTSQRSLLCLVFILHMLWLNEGAKRVAMRTRGTVS